MKHEVTGFASGAGIGLKSVVYHMKLPVLVSPVVYHMKIQVLHSGSTVIA